MIGQRRGASSRYGRGRWVNFWVPRIRLLGAALALLGLIGVGHGGLRILLDPAYFPLRRVVVAADLHYMNHRDVRQLVNNYLGDNFFSLDIVALRQGVLSNPWVEQVSIQRVWPDAVRVTFQERQPFGHWGSEEMVDGSGHRFQPIRFRHIEEWPQLQGPDGHEKQLLDTYRRASAMIDRLDLRIVQLIQDERRAWRVIFDNGIELLLGREQFVTRLQRFVDVYPRVLAARATQVATVDLRYVDGFAVRWTAVEGNESSQQRTDRGQGKARTAQTQAVIVAG